MTDFPSPVALPVALPHGPLTKQLREAVEAELAAQIPAGKKGAAVAIAGHEGITLSVATKVGEHWRLGGEVQRKWGGDISGRVVVTGTW